MPRSRRAVEHAQDKKHPQQGDDTVGIHAQQRLGRQGQKGRYKGAPAAVRIGVHFLGNQVGEKEACGVGHPVEEDTARPRMGDLSENQQDDGGNQGAHHGDAVEPVVEIEGTAQAEMPCGAFRGAARFAHENILVLTFTHNGRTRSLVEDFLPVIFFAVSVGQDPVAFGPEGLILDGIVAGVGAVLGFVPQMLVLFLLLAILEACGYMARIAFIMDRIFRRFGLSGKSFIPILIGTGCGVPGIMASRTIENERDRRMTIMTTTFIPCGAKTPFIAMIAGAIFGGSPWVATSAYFIGMAAIIVSGIILKKTKLFSGDPAPFVMELPAYHIPTVGNVLRSMWERGWSFIKKAGTIILLSTIVVWFTTYFGFTDDGFRMLAEDEIDMSILAKIGSAICWIFTPLGWGNWQAAVASITGLVAKENIVGTMGILYGGGDLSPYAALALQFTKLAGFSFLTFNLLCAPCFAAIGAIKREMNSAKWTWTAIGYQCGFAYVVSLCIYNIGRLIADGAFSFWTVIAFLLVIAFIYLLFRPTKEAKEYKKAAGVN